MNWKMASLSITVIMACLILLFWDTSFSMYSVWMGSETYKHCFLIIPIVLFLLWDKQDQFKTLSPQPFLPALILFPGLGLGWVIAHIAGINFGEHLMLVGFLQATLLTILGYRVYWAFLFPFSYLWFLIPVGDFLVPALQDITTWFSVLFLNLANIPNFNDGVFITIPTGDFEVAEACAGLRFLIATIVLGFLFAHLFYKSTGRRLLFVALSIIIPIFTNGIRAFGIIFIAYVSNHKYAVGVDHLVYGWFFFAFVLAILIGVGLLFREDLSEDDKIDAAKMKQIKKMPMLAPKQVILPSLMIVGLSLAPWLYAYNLDHKDLQSSSFEVENIISPIAPLQIQSCQTDWVPDFNTTHKALFCLTTGNEIAELFIGFYPTQNQLYEVISYHNKSFDDDLWRRKSTFSETLSVHDKSIPTSIDHIWTRQGEFYIAKIYWINGTFIKSPLRMKINRLISQFKNGHQAAYVLLIKIPTINKENQNIAVDEVLEDIIGNFKDFPQKLEEQITKSNQL